MSKKHKVMLIILGVAIILEFPWYHYVIHRENQGAFKTTATVIRIDRERSYCPPRSFCSRADELYPVYQYYDQQGNVHIVDNRYLESYKEDNPLRLIDGKKVGDKVTAFYGKDDPKRVDFISGAPMYFALLLPISLAISGLVAYEVTRFVVRRSNVR